MDETIKTEYKVEKKPEAKERKAPQILVANPLGAYVREEPSVSGAVVRKVDPGVKLDITGKPQDGWYRVEDGYIIASKAVRL